MTPLIEEFIDKVRNEAYCAMSYDIFELWGYLASQGINQLPATAIKGVVGDEILTMNSH